MNLAALLAAAGYCLLSVPEHGWLVHAVRMGVRLDAAFCFLWYLRLFLTKNKMLRNVTKMCDMFANGDICHQPWE